MQKYKPYIISFAITFGIAIIGSIVTYLGMDSFSRLIQPPLSPPGFLFPIVWTILYGLMAFGAARIFQKTGNIKDPAIYVFAAQMLFNLGWSVLFFGLDAYLLAFIWLIILWILVLIMIILFYRIDRLSGLLQIPYLLWLTFAAYLNLAIYLIN